MPELDQEADTSQDDVDTSASEDESTDNDQEDTGAGADQEETDTSDDQEDDDSTEETDSDTDSEDDDDSESTDDDTSEDDDDDDDLELARPDLPSADQEVENFDIRTLPRDPATGLLDPDAANKAVQDWVEKRDEARAKRDEKLSETRQVLTQQWGKVKDRYPHIWSNKRLIEEVRDKHLNSFGDNKNYLSPMAAAKEVQKTYKIAVRSGVKQAKSKRQVEQITTPNRGGGKPAATGDQEYANLRKQALSNNPAEAKQARLALLKYRRTARQSS